MICNKCGTNNLDNSKFCSKCGNTFEAQNSSPAQGTGNITISRVKMLWGFAVSFKVLIDGQQVGFLTNGGNIVVAVPYGSHLVKLSLLGSKIAENVILNEQQKNVVLTIKPKMGLLAARPYLVNKIYN